MKDLLIIILVLIIVAYILVKDHIDFRKETNDEDEERICAHTGEW